MSERDRIEQALTFDTGCEPSAQEIIDALNRAGFQITPQAGEAEPVAWYCTQDGKTIIPSGFITDNIAYKYAHKECNWMPLYRTAPPSPVAPVWQPPAALLTRIQSWRSGRQGALDEHEIYCLAVDMAEAILSALPPDSPGAEEE